MHAPFHPLVRNAILAVGIVAAGAALAQTAASPMSFFVTSTNPGKGADLGGIDGADKHCQALAQAAGAGQKTWRAYLSTTGVDGKPPVNARDRIGAGPWHNAKGELIAANVQELHGANKLTKQTALTEKGATVNGRGDTPNVHDILTGSTPEGRSAGTGGSDTTCRDWTSGDAGAALVGHHDRMGLNDEPPAKSWNSSHPSRGCSMDALKASGGGGLLYCFATN